MKPTTEPTHTTLVREGEESVLVQQAQAGDASAVTEIYRRYYSPVYRYVYYRLPDAPTAEDLAADVFVRLVTHLDSLEYGGRPLLAWLYTVARNLVLDHQRRAGRLAGILAEMEPERAYLHVEPSVERTLSHVQLAAALSQLTEDQRLVIALKFFEDLSNREAAQMLGKTEGAVKSLQHRALAALRRFLEETPR